MISIIVATGENRVIGKNNQLVWHLPADLKRFKRLTMGHAMIMGRKTFESIGKALPGRTTIIVTRQKGFKKENCLIADSLEEAIALCRDDNEAFIIGGAQIFEKAIPLTDKIYLTRIHQSFDGDVFFPELEKEKWKITFGEDHKADEKNPYDYSFINYEKIN
ncbi:MAG TPA: dihydrofolate reductase [Bacteroidia bacterium]|nr:dihydrofolate reductase [Bacteroidia bacterium]